MESINVSFDEAKIIGLHDEEAHECLRFENELLKSHQDTDSGDPNTDLLNSDGVEIELEDFTDVEGEQHQSSTGTTGTNFVSELSESIQSLTKANSDN